MFKFPLVEPEITITELPEENFEVEVLDQGSGFALLEVGDETEFAFYDYRTDYRKDCAPKAAQGLVLTGSHRIRVTRRIRVDDFEMLEIQSHYADVGSDYTDPPAFWNSVVSEAGLDRIVEVQAPGQKTWTHKPGEKTIPPRLLRPGLKVDGHEPQYPVEDRPGEVSQWHLEVIGAFCVNIGAKEYRCLRVHWTSGDAMLDYFVADTGRTVYVRRFNGPGWEKYGELEGNPQHAYDGIVWRHWYDCLPDHTLIIGR